MFQPYTFTECYQALILVKLTEKYSQFGGTILYCSNVQYTVGMCSLQFPYLSVFMQAIAILHGFYTEKN